ncbi:protein MIS12 homolog [Nymphaea colorata]|nr:protein MIS12 homolog [Nymphaea colorata]XP_031472938.1 protein MIS12 homolog [Nymphaea colorata]XP_031472939.1 protein MIS12 homolog [Nymphaea colorata]
MQGLVAMEGTKSEAVFDSLNVNPQLFVNEVLNSVDDIVDGGFKFYESEAARILGVSDESKLAELSKGVSAVKRFIQSTLNRHLSIWEKYCLTHCFSVPEGFSLPKRDVSDDTDFHQGEPCRNKDLDAELDSLREKLVLAEREAGEMRKEISALEKQSSLSRSYLGAVTEAAEELEENAVDKMFQELLSTAAELRTKLEKLRPTRHEATEDAGVDAMEIQSSTLPNGICGKLEDLLEFANAVKSM